MNKMSWTVNPLAQQFTTSHQITKISVHYISLYIVDTLTN